MPRLQSLQHSGAQTGKLSPGEGTRHKNCLQVQLQQMPRGWLCPDLEFTTREVFCFLGFRCFVETGILTSNGKAGFSKRWWSEVIRAERGEFETKPKAA